MRDSLREHLEDGREILEKLAVSKVSPGLLTSRYVQRRASFALDAIELREILEWLTRGACPFCGSENVDPYSDGDVHWIQCNDVDSGVSVSVQEREKFADREYRRLLLGVAGSLVDVAVAHPIPRWDDAVFWRLGANDPSMLRRAAAYLIRRIESIEADRP